MAIHLFRRRFRLESRRYLFRMRHNHAEIEWESNGRNLVILRWRFFVHFPVSFVHHCPYIFENVAARLWNIFSSRLLILRDANNNRSRVGSMDISKLIRKSADTQFVINNVTLVPFKFILLLSICNLDYAKSAKFRFRNLQKSQLRFTLKFVETFTRRTPSISILKKFLLSLSFSLLWIPRISK